MFEGFTLLVQLLNHCEVFNVAVAHDNFFLSLQNLYREYKWGGKCNLNFLRSPKHYLPALQLATALFVVVVKTCRHILIKN